MRSGLAILLGLLLLPSAAAGQNPPPAAAPDAAAIVRRAIQLRLDEAKHPQPFQYLLRKIDDKHDTTKLIIETKDGDVARLVAIGGKPLPPDVNSAEFARLDALAQHPEIQEKRRKSEQKDEDRITHLLGQLPDAFLYKIEAIVPCPANPSSQCYQMTFTPNPSYSPPDMESELLRGAAGQVWIDRQQQRLTRLDARFTSNVDLGFGMLARLNRGSTVSLEQADIGGRDWELTGLQVHATGKLLLFKSFTSQINEKMTHFSAVPPSLGYREAIALAKKFDPSEAYTP